MTIEEYCKQQNITQGELASRLHVCKAYVTKLKYHQIYPNYLVKQHLLELGIDVPEEDNLSRKDKHLLKINELNNEVKKLEIEIKKLKKVNSKLFSILNKKYEKEFNELIKRKLYGKKNSTQTN